MGNHRRHAKNCSACRTWGSRDTCHFDMEKELASRITYIRLVIQAVAFAAIFYVFTYSIPLLYVLIVVFAMTIVLGRLYCGWLCPFGLVMDLVIPLRKAFGIRYRNVPEKLNKILHQSRYVILLFFLFLPIVLWLNQPPPNLNFAVVMAQLLAGPFRPYSVLLDPLIPIVVPWKTSPVSLLIQD